MAKGRNNQNRPRSQVPSRTISSTPAPKPAATDEVLVTGSPLPQTPEVVEDTLTQKQTVPQPVQEEVVVPEPVIEVTPVEDEIIAVPDATSDLVEADGLVMALNEKIEDFKIALAYPGKLPADFKEAAKKAALITKFVIKYPKMSVLNALLVFFVEHKDGLARADSVMKGSTTLPRSEEQQVGVLFNLFLALASRRVQSVSTSFVTNILKKPEIVNFYNRKAAGIRASK